MTADIASFLDTRRLAPPHLVALGEQSLAHALIGYTQYYQPDHLVVLTSSRPSTTPQGFRVIDVVEAALPFGSADSAESIHRICESLRKLVTSSQEGVALNACFARLSAQWGRSQEAGKYVSASIAWAGSDADLWRSLAALAYDTDGRPAPEVQLAWNDPKRETVWIPVTPGSSAPHDGKAGREIHVFVPNNIVGNPEFKPNGVQSLAIKPQLNALAIETAAQAMIPQLQQEDRFQHARESDLLDLAKHQAEFDQPWFTAWMFSTLPARAEHPPLDGSLLIAAMRTDGLDRLADTLESSINGSVLWEPWDAAVGPLILNCANCTPLRIALFINTLLQYSQQPASAPEHKIIITPIDLLRDETCRLSVERVLRQGRKWNVNMVLCSDDVHDRVWTLPYVGGSMVIGDHLMECSEFVADLEWQHITEQIQAVDADVVNIQISQGSWDMIGGNDRVRQLCLSLMRLGKHYRICLYGSSPDTFLRLKKRLTQSKGVFHSATIPSPTDWEKVHPCDDSDSGFFLASRRKKTDPATEDNSEVIIAFELTTTGEAVSLIRFGQVQAAVVPNWASDEALAATSFTYYHTHPIDSGSVPDAKE